MKTGNVLNAQNLYNQYNNVTKPAKGVGKGGNAVNAHNLFADPVDTYTPSAIKGAADPAMINKLWKDTDYFADTIRRLVSSLLGRNDASGQGFWAISAEASYKYSETIISGDGFNFESRSVEASFKYEAYGFGGGSGLNEVDRAQAQELIGEEGFFGVKQTTARIMDFAKALVGVNAGEDKIELMRDAVQKGFDEVARMFGGFDNLPDVSKKTYEAIMKAFDEWLYGKAFEDQEDAA